MNEFHFPKELPNYDNQPFVGSLNQILNCNTGNFVECVIFTGLDTIRQIGILTGVGTEYIVLFNNYKNSYNIIKLETIVYFAFLDPKSTCNCQN